MRFLRIAIALIIFSASVSPQQLHKLNPAICGDCMNHPLDWYGSADASRIADNFLLYQRREGGWPKNIKMAEQLTAAERAGVIDESELNDSTIDNGATHTQLQFLARVYDQTREQKYQDAFLRGLDYLLRAQYPNGGWPQYFPLRTNYSRRITFNDDAMTDVMNLMLDVRNAKPPFAWIDAGHRTRATDAMDRGLAIILKTQIRANGKLTAWCAQYDETTLEPASARTYELVSISGSESVGIVKFLMRLEHPSPEVVNAIESAVQWFRDVAIVGYRIEDRADSSMPDKYDRVLVKDSSAPPLWARFYEIGSNRPFFSGRDGIKKYDMREIEYERRAHYGWYGNWAVDLLSRDYPAWKQRLAQLAR